MGLIGCEVRDGCAFGVSQQRVTELLAKWSQGDRCCPRRINAAGLRRPAPPRPSLYERPERPDHTLQATALVNEAYLRMADQTNPSWQNRAHFVAVAARAMRHILVDYAEGLSLAKAGRGRAKLELDEAALVTPEQSQEIVDLHEALERLAALDARKAEVVD